ncbi:MAG: A/G-specific adenine glycosylase [Candidatus Aminicenantes bacterium]|nr:A/G-specific adenine glycosylase [Candidatus Aminicenantes bacterium]
MNSPGKPASNRPAEKTPFTGILLSWYRRHGRHLPWRETKDPYRVWVSEIMLQQTTVKAVIPYYDRWMKLFPDMNTLSHAPLQTVLKAWEGLGYYQRARNMKEAAEIFVERYGSRIPPSYETLIKLPGFGPYTTAAVLSIAFDLPYPVLDSNVRRVLMRYFLIEGKSTSKNDNLLRNNLNPLLPPEKMGDFNQALMVLGALVCTPGNPQCLLCPVREGCRGFEAGKQEVIPEPITLPTTRLDAVVAVFEHDGRFLIQQRPPSGLLAGLWEFPGGKIERGESHQEALLREIREELAADIEVGPYLTGVTHAYTRFVVTLHVYECRLKKEPKKSATPRRWITLKGMKRFPFPSGSARIIRFLEARAMNRPAEENQTR